MVPLILFLSIIGNFFIYRYIMGNCFGKNYNNKLRNDINKEIDILFNDDAFQYKKIDYVHKTNNLDTIIK